MDQQPLYNIGTSWFSDEDTNGPLNVYVADQLFQIDLCTANFEDSPTVLEEYLRHLRRGHPDYIPEDSDESDNFADSVEEMYDWAMNPFLPLFRQVPPAVPEPELHSQRLFTFRKVALHVAGCGRQAVTVALSTIRESRPVGALLPPSTEVDHSMFRVFRSDEVVVSIGDDSTTLPAPASKVFIRGQQESFFKMVMYGHTLSTQRELIACAKIQSAQFGAEVRISRLHGFVQDEATGRVIGLLLPNIHTDWRAYIRALRDPECSSLRQKWVDQISYTLKSFHAYQIVWGGGRPENVLIDLQGDVYLIDFGGSSIPGWVDKELANTMEGDLQALEKITYQYINELH